MSNSDWERAAYVMTPHEAHAYLRDAPRRRGFASLWKRAAKQYRLEAKSAEGALLDEMGANVDRVKRWLAQRAELEAENAALKEKAEALTHFVNKACDTYRAHLAERALLREALEGVRWRRIEREYRVECAYCGDTKISGTHEPDCIVGRALNGGGR